MASSTVTLGPVTFTNREVPDKMPHGGKQALAIHKNLGGVRTVDAMGPDPHPIKWSGLLLGPAAAGKSRLLEALAYTGTEMRLSWGSFNYLVVISEYEGDYKHEWEIGYTITVEISTINGVTPYSALVNIIQQDFAAAAGNPALPASVTGAINSANSVVKAVGNAQPNGSLSNASLTALAPAIAAVEAAYAIVASQVQSTEAAIQGINLDAPQGNSTLEGFDAFQVEANNLASESDLLVAQAYLGRVVGNLTSMAG